MESIFFMPLARGVSKMYNTLSVSWQWSVCSNESAKCSQCNLPIQKKRYFSCSYVQMAA